MESLAGLSLSKQEEGLKSNASKRRGVVHVDKDTQALLNMHKLHVKATLSLSQQIKDVRSAVLWQCKLVAESQYVIKAKEAMQQFEKLFKSLKAAEGVEAAKTKTGAPSVFVFNSWAQLALQNTTEVTPEVITALRAVMMDLKPAQVLAALPVCKVAKMYNQARKGIEMSCPAVNGTKADVSKMDVRYDDQNHSHGLDKRKRGSAAPGSSATWRVRKEIARVAGSADLEATESEIFDENVKGLSAVHGDCRADLVKSDVP